MPENSSAKIVLIVEDSPTTAESVCAALTEKGLKVVWASDGPSGLQKVKEIHPDLIIMDINMPGMNGFQVVQALKQNPESTSIPVVMLTSSETPESVLEGFNSGAVDFIPKDVFAMSVLVETIKQMGLLLSE